MKIYNVLLILTALFAFLNCVCVRNNKITIVLNNNIKISLSKIFNLILLLMFIFLFIISAFRTDNVGIDMVRYIPRFRVIRSYDFNALLDLSKRWSFEYGFTIFCKLISFLSSKDQIFQIITSLIVCFGFCKYINQFSKIPMISLLIFVCYGYFGNSMNIVRQSLAISLIAISICQYKNNNKLLSCLLFLIAISFHSTSIVALFLLPYLINANKKFNLKATIIMLIFSLALYFIPKSILDYFLLKTSFGWYINQSGSGESILLFNMFCFFFTVKNRNKIFEFDKNIDLWLWSLSLAIFSNILALKIGLFERVMRIFMLPIMLIIPDIILLFKHKKYYFFIVILVIAAFIAYFYIFIMNSYSSSGGIIPYESVFTN